MGSLFPENTVYEAFVKQICCGLRAKISLYMPTATAAAVLLLGLVDALLAK
jgi:hypothetical protein